MSIATLAWFIGISYTIYWQKTVPLSQVFVLEENYIKRQSTAIYLIKRTDKGGVINQCHIQLP
jgi:hypothetical protein